jgi:phospholipid/cholesterol/gamma-HCH transport system substrate-binding protein
VPANYKKLKAPSGIVIYSYFYSVNQQQPTKSIVKSLPTIIILILVVGGYFFMKKSKILSTEHEYLAYFDDIQGLQASSPVMIKGVRVGKIADINLNEGARVQVIIALKDRQLPSGSVAKLAAGGVTGEKIVDIEQGPGPAMLAEHATLPTALDSSVLPVSARVTPILEATKILLRTTDSTLQSISVMVGTPLVRKITYGIVNLEQKTQGLARASASLAKRTDGIGESINSFNRKSTDLAASGKEFKRDLSEVEQKTAGYVKKDISSSLVKLRGSIDRIRASAQKIDTSMSGIGKWVNDKSSVDAMTKSLDTMNRGYQNAYKNPSGFSIFSSGKK